MKVLLGNKFFYHRGGAESVFFDTTYLLEKKGHKVISFSMKHPRNYPSPYEKYFISNVDYKQRGFKNRVNSSLKALYSFEAKTKIEELIKKEKPDIAHLHNTYHQISPSILHTLKKFNIPIVLTLHDYKMVCASYLMLCRGKVCEACRDGRYYSCFLKGCAANSGVKNLVNTIEMYLHHRVLNIYDLVDVFIAPSRFLKNKLEEMGFRKKIVFLPYLIKSDEISPEYNWTEKSIVYFGRLTNEKGLFTLLDAVKKIKGVTVKIIGEGPREEDIRTKLRIEKIWNVKLLGYKSGSELESEIKKSMFSILPAEYYDNSPRAIIESMAIGKPVVGSRIGGIPELIRDNETGLTFEPGNAKDLRAKIEYLVNNQDQIVKMGKNARSFVEKELNADKHYNRLMGIYNQAIGIRSQGKL